MPKTLYVCYFGLREPLVQTQVLPYLRGIVEDDVRVSLLTFEPDLARRWTRAEIAEEKTRLSEEGIDWHHLPYHKRPSAPATAWDVLAGAFYVWRLMRREKFDVLHGRVHIPTLMAAIARKLSRHKPKLLFDIRGFFPEEYTDAGIWPENGLLYRAAKRVERWLLKEADAFVVLTERAREILFPEAVKTGYDRLGRPIEVIPCCVDIQRFEAANEASRSQIRAELEIGDRYAAVYVGAFGGWYLTEETAQFLGALKAERPDAFAMILTQSPVEVIEPLLTAQGYGPRDRFVKKVSPADIPKYLSGADLAVSFIKNCYSKQASSPTKNAEYLACGLPIIANAGVGDVDHMISTNEVGALIHNFDRDTLTTAIRDVESMGKIGERCRIAANRMFSLSEVGAERYRRLYRNLLGSEK